MMRSLPAAKSMPKPALIFDKSAFQALSRREHAERLSRYEENVTPILLREILGDLAKDGSGTPPKKVVQVLAGKFLGSGGVINADHRKLCAGDLTGTARFPMDGRPVLDEYTEAVEPDGSTSIFIDLMEGNRSILRWARANFSDADLVTATKFRTWAGAFSIEALSGRLRQHHVLLPRPKTLTDLQLIADDLLERGSLQAAFLDWLIEQLRLPPVARGDIVRRWQSEGRPRLAVFAPYAYHCARVLLLLLIGMRHNLLSLRPTNRLDAEYLFYVPFCEVFVSDDRLHTQLAPMVLGPGRSFVPLREFKREMANRVAERDSRHPPTKP
jgi:hypothetical protein